MEFPTPHHEMMWNFMVAAFEDKDADQHFDRGMELLRGGTINPFEMDNQLFRELRAKRWKAERRLAIYDALAYIIVRNSEK